MFKKTKLINYSILITDDKIFFNPIESKEKEVPGFSFYSYENENYKVFLQAENIKESVLFDLKLIFKDDFLNNVKYIYNCLNEIFQLYIWNKKESIFYTITDYLGVGTNYVYLDNKKTVFFSNFLNIKDLGIQLKISAENLYNYLSIGYQVSPFKLPYTHIDTHKGATLYSYKNKEVSAELIKPEISLIKNINTILIDSIENNNIEKVFFGATAGKDSLALVSLIKNKKNKLLGSFGDKRSADVIQGEKIANHIDIDHIYQDYASASEFRKFSSEIALISGGLTTTSYVDMLCFVNKSIPHDYTYIMGEGGECVRDFFRESKKIEDSLENYITPIEFLNKTLVKNNFHQLFKNTLIRDINKKYKKEPLLKFYRHERMPGNFSNRHKILSIYRPKYSPFLNYNFIRNTYNLDEEKYKNSKLHREIIFNEASFFIEWFDNPIKTDITSQNYEERFLEYIGEILLNIFNNMSVKSQLYFSKKGLIDLLQGQFKKVDRGAYYLLRVASFIIFIDLNQGLFVTE